MAKRIVFLTVMACGIIIIAIAFVSIRKMDSDRTPPTETETETQTSESGNDVRSTTPRQAAIPQDSGRSFHAIDLLNIPEPVEEKLITVDVWSVPIPVPTVYGGISYRYDNLPPRLAVPTKKMGLIFNRMIEDRVCLFDVMSENPDGDFFYGTDHTYEGQVAVEMSAPYLIPDTQQLWDLEPIGMFEGTTRQGLVVQIHKFRFWRYHVSRQDASAPTNVAIPLQDLGQLLTKTTESDPIPGGNWASSCVEQKAFDPTDLEQARAFILTLQAAIRTADKSKLETLVDYPLKVNIPINGGVENLVAASPEIFATAENEIFTEYVRSTINRLNASGCLTRKGDSFTIGEGMLWFNRSKSGSYKIFSINGSM